MISTVVVCFTLLVSPVLAILSFVGPSSSKRYGKLQEQKSMNDRWHNDQVYLCKFLCWKKVFMMHSALLQNSCSRSILLSLRQYHPAGQLHPSIHQHRF